MCVIMCVRQRVICVNVLVHVCMRVACVYVCKQVCMCVYVQCVHE